jgi:hypothetical protein
MFGFLPVVGIGLLLVGGFAAVYGRRQHRRRALVEATETTAIRDIKAEGTVELKGTIRASDPVESPITGEPSVMSAWEVEEWDETGDSEMWETLATGIHTRPFELDDGTGRVRVEIDEYLLDAPSGTGIDEIQLGPIDVDRLLSNGVTVDNVLAAIENFAVETTVPPGTEPPERIEEFVHTEPGLAPQTDPVSNVIDIGNEHGKRRYYEGTLGPGDDIYLLGEVRATESAPAPLQPDDVVVTVPEHGQMIVSDKSEEELADSLNQYKYAYVGAILAVAGGIAALALGTGIL